MLSRWASSVLNLEGRAGRWHVGTSVATRSVLIEQFLSASRLEPAACTKHGEREVDEASVELPARLDAFATYEFTMLASDGS